MRNDIVVIDDFIPIELQNEIEETLLSKHFPWFFVSDITYGDKSLNTPSMFHLYKSNYIQNSHFYDLTKHIVFDNVDKINYEFTDVYQSRSILQFPLKQDWVKRHIDLLHVDTPQKHYVVLYYVTDADGDTILVDKKLESVFVETNLRYEDYPLIKRVTPKKGRVLMFPGEYYHTSELPKENIRCIINFNLT